jgi:hypothetical protein
MDDLIKYDCELGFLLRAMRGRGWRVAVHNDYSMGGEAYTFWLFTHPNGSYVKGEGKSDLEALRIANMNMWAHVG